MENTNIEKSERALREEKILKFWKENKIFEKSLEKNSTKKEFVFYEGPPTANGRPGIHHIEARSFKDAIPRYKTMRGYNVPRKGGWDTHGLPVELEVEKHLGLKSKKEIEEYGIAKFNAECKKSVWKYVDEWIQFTDRMGYWVDIPNAYVTYHNSYIEVLWKILNNVEERGLLYKDYKVLPWCPRCGTALSSHELAQGYADVKDLSVYVKFKIKGSENTYFLAWTTTPWTLPGNVALAVGRDIVYVEAKIGKEIYILAKERLSVLGGDYEIVNEYKGSEILNMEYEPLYSFIKDSYKGEDIYNAFKVYEADFVTTTDGTGIVHTAVMYGQDDFVLGTKYSLPKYHTVHDTGHFKNDTGFLGGRFVKDEETVVEIIKDLAHRGLLFKKEKYEHSYPHCWRCKTPLIYYARDSWYIAMSKLKDELIKENQKINWEPDYIKNGRFGEWLKEIKDWAISRERYWGTPLPIWINSNGTKRLVIDSIPSLIKYAKKSENKYFVMRHGETKANVKDVVSYKNEASDELTEEGKKEVIDSAQKLKNENIDLIITSPFKRARETAELVRASLGLKEDSLILDERLKEINPGEYDGRSWVDYHNYFYEKGGKKWFEQQIPNGESLRDVGKRVGSCLHELEEKYKNTKILIITHGGIAWLTHVISGLNMPEGKDYERSGTHVFVNDFKRFDNAEVRELPFVKLPHNENYEIDLHRPFIDEMVLVKEGEEYHRTKEVMDVWFDSGAMPFAQNPKKVAYPADFISEAIDQTRGWFYTLHAIGLLMGKGLSYKNVICLGHILDKDGKKMSKSLGNGVNPWEMMDKYGVDTLRLWMYSVNQPGDSKNFDERSVDEISKRVFNLIDNVYSFYSLYRNKELESAKMDGANNILDQWILAKLSALVASMTHKLDNYKLLEPVREMRGFIDDLSTWYLRRSRERIKDGDREAKQTLYFVLREISKLIAPLAPFIAEELYQKLRTETDKESVHLENWPDTKDFQDDIITKMDDVRKLSSLALEARSKANIKVRQPLKKLTISNTKLTKEYLEILRDEINVKEVVVEDGLEKEVLLDTIITEELEEEGKLRELLRKIQDWRKENDLKPGDKARYSVAEEDMPVFDKYKEEIVRATNIDF